MFVFDDTGVGFVVTGVVNNGIALVVGRVFNARLESDSTPVEFTELEIEILVNRAAIYYFGRFKFQVAGFKFP